MKVISSLENRGILLKRTTRKVNIQEGRFLNFFRPLMTVRCSYSKKNHGLGTTALIISNEEMKDIVKIVKSLEESGLLIQGSSENEKQLKMKQKNKKEDFSQYY